MKKRSSGAAWQIGLGAHVGFEFRALQMWLEKKELKRSKPFLWDTLVGQS